MFPYQLLILTKLKSFLNLLTGTNGIKPGLRIHFLASVFLVAVSVFIRKNMAESPLFEKAKSEGKTSTNPLKDLFGNKANLKVVLLTISGLTPGIGVVGYFYFICPKFSYHMYVC